MLMLLVSVTLLRLRYSTLSQGCGEERDREGGKWEHGIMIRDVHDDIDGTLCVENLFKQNTNKRKETDEK